MFRMFGNLIAGHVCVCVCVCVCATSKATELKAD